MTRASNPGRRLWLGAALAGLLAAGLTGCDKLGLSGSAKPSFHGVDITGADYGRKLDLTDAEGKPRSLADFKGKVSVVFFGYTQCPDVCPTTMAELAAIKRAMGKDGDRVQGIFVTVDPERDTQPVMAQYLTAFDPQIVGLTGSPEAIDAMLDEFHVFHEKVAGENGDYTMNHTAAFYLFDADAQFADAIDYNDGRDAAVAAIRALIYG